MQIHTMCGIAVRWCHVFVCNDYSIARAACIAHSLIMHNDCYEIVGIVQNNILDEGYYAQ